MKKDDFRKTSRLPVQTQVEIYPVFPSYKEWLSESGVEFMAGQLYDLSRGGLGLFPERPLLEGSILKFHFSLRRNRQVEIFGKIIWSLHKRAGARFYLLAGGPPKTGVALPSPNGFRPLLPLP
jgi:hypothetical protein